MELDCVLLGLIRLHPDVTGYELNRIIKESTGYLMSASLSHIYPSLRKLHEKGQVEFIDLPIKNRLAKKIYRITPAGEQALQVWLQTPIEYNDIDFRPFMLKMSFSPLMTKQMILEHVNREIERREQTISAYDRGNYIEMNYLDRNSVDPEKAESLWKAIYEVGIQTSRLRLEWLRKWRQKIQTELQK